MRRALYLLFILLLTFSSFPAASQGIKTDLGVYPESALPPLGPAGFTFTDGLSGTPILRLTDERDCPAGCGTYYSYWQTPNANNTRLLVGNYGGPAFLLGFDPVNSTRGAREELPSAPGRGTPFWEGAVWSRTDPDTLYCTVGAAVLAYHPSARTYDLLADASADMPGEYMIQTSLSRDGRRVAFTRKRSSDFQPVGFGVYDLAAKKLTLKITRDDMDEATIAGDGRRVVVKTNKQGADAVEQVVYDVDTGSSVELIDDADRVGGHGDAGTDSYVGYDNHNNRLNWRRLSDPKQVRDLLTFPDWTQAIHTSMLADDESWALVGLFGEQPIPPRRLPSGEEIPVPWNRFRKEIIQVATDGSQRVRRLFHHRSVYRRYEDSPRANISRDGRFVFFTSNMGGTRPDLYVAKITPPGAAPAPTPTPAPSPTPTPTPAPAPVQYEYRQETWPASAASRLALLNRLGAEGWEWTGLNSSPTFFKRVKR